MTAGGRSIWQNHALSSGVSFAADPLIERRIQDFHAAIARSLNERLYGDDIAAPALSLRQRTIRRLKIYQTRISDSWSVLTGRAEVGYY